jgi:hypothetical protein
VTEFKVSIVEHINTFTPNPALFNPLTKRYYNIEVENEAHEVRLFMFEATQHSWLDV